MKQKLPNANTVLILGILSIFTCCLYGIVGIILGIIAIILANKDLKLYLENPENYNNYSAVTTGRILAIIGIALSGIYLIFTIYFLSLGEQGMKDFQQNLMEKMKHQEEQGLN